MICLNFNFRGGGVFWNWKVKVPKSLTIFILGGGILYFRIGVFCRIWTKFSTTPAGSCITDSLSHTTYVETNYTYRHTPFIALSKHRSQGQWRSAVKLDKCFLEASDETKCLKLPCVIYKISLLSPGWKGESCRKGRSCTSGGNH